MAKLSKEAREAKTAKFRETMRLKREAKEAKDKMGKDGYPVSFEKEKPGRKERRAKAVEPSNVPLALDLMKLAIRALEGR